MKQKSIVLLLLICLISALVLPAAATEVPAVETPVTDFTPLDTTAPAEVFTGVPGSALLIELNSGVTLFAHNAAERRYPASLTKIMTALLALEHGNLDDQITVSETALENLHEDGSTVGLQPERSSPSRICSTASWWPRPTRPATSSPSTYPALWTPSWR